MVLGQFRRLAFARLTQRQASAARGVAHHFDDRHRIDFGAVAEFDCRSRLRHSYVDGGAVIVDHEIEVAEGGIVRGILQRRFASKTLIDGAHFHQKWHQIPIGVMAAAATAVGLNAHGGRGELDVHAMAAHRDHFRRLRHHNGAWPHRPDQLRALHDFKRPRLRGLLICREEQRNRHLFGQRAGGDDQRGILTLHIGAAETV
jgi:hypothetical protein